MRRIVRVVVVDDHGQVERFYRYLFGRMEQEWNVSLEVIWLDGEILFSQDLFTPERVMAELRKTAPEVILLDAVLHQTPGHHDYLVCNMLLRELRDDEHLRKLPLLLLSQFFESHCMVKPDCWQRWCFSKGEIQNDAGLLAQFAELVSHPDRLAVEQGDHLEGPTIWPKSR